MKTSKPQHWQILFWLWTVQGIAALYRLVTIPTDTENPVVLGFSSARAILIGITIALITVSILLWLYTRGATFQTWLHSAEHFLFWDLTYILALFAMIGSVIFFVVIPLFDSDSLYPVHAARLLPIVLWFGLSGLELALLMIWNRKESSNAVFTALRPIWKATIFLGVVFLLLAGFVALTRIGLTPEDNWGDPPIPFFEWQVFLVLAFVGVLSFYPQLVANRNSKWIPLAIYIFTVILWLSQPINTAFSATPPRAPNFEIYPFSDPQFYAQYAQSALVGSGFSWPEVPARPFYVGFLTWLHLLGNQKYQNVIVLQTLVLALFPVLLYLLGKEIGGRPLGLGLALLAAFRDVNSNVVVRLASNVTYSKLLLSELPTALLISLATLLSIRWLRMSNRLVWFPLLIGGLLGAAALIRLQSSILIFLIIFLAFFVISDHKQWLKGSILIILGFTITIIPWLTRNYLAAGGLVLDNPISQTMTMTRRWSGSTGNETLVRLPGENDAQYSSRLTKMAIAAFVENPGFILRSATNHFINNELAGLLAFPARDKLATPSELLWPRHVFWTTPLTGVQIPLLAFYLLLFSIGVAAAWHHHKLIGLLPLGLGLVYNVWTALFLSSGERFIVPLDWSIHLYELFGLLLLGGFLLSFTNRAHENISAWMRMPFDGSPAAVAPPALSRRSLMQGLVVVILLGSFLPVTESIFPQRYPPKSQAEIMQEIGMMAEEGEVALYGRAVYPRYYDAGDGEPGTAKLGYGKAEEASLVFFLVGPQTRLVIFELENQPQFFPHASDVYMVGTQTENYFSPRIVKVIKGLQTELYISK